MKYGDACDYLNNRDHYGCQHMSAYRCRTSPVLQGVQGLHEKCTSTCDNVLRKSGMSTNCLHQPRHGYTRWNSCQRGVIMLLSWLTQFRAHVQLLRRLLEYIAFFGSSYEHTSCCNIPETISECSLHVYQSKPAPGAVSLFQVDRHQTWCADPGCTQCVTQTRASCPLQDTCRSCAFFTVRKRLNRFRPRYPLQYR